MLEINLLPQQKNKIFLNKKIMLVPPILIMIFLLVTQMPLSEKSVLPAKKPMVAPVASPVIFWKGYLASQNDFLGLLQVSGKIIAVRKGSVLENGVRVIRMTKKGVWLMVSGKQEYVGDVV